MRRRKKKFAGGRVFSEGLSFLVKKKSGLEKKDLDQASFWQEGLLGERFGGEGNFFSGRTLFLFMPLFFCFLVLFGRLFYLQVLKGKENFQKSRENRIQLLTIHAPRGMIFDRHGKVLANNTPGFRMIKREGEDDAPRFLEYEEALALEAEDVVLEIDSIRSYPDDEVLAHVLGYTSEISKEELALPDYFGYQMGDRIGRSGVEAVFEKYLRGQNGRQLVEVDALGRQLKVLGEEEPKSGPNLYLALDRDLQKVLYSSLKVGMDDAGVSAGVAIAQDPNNGQILGMVSLPSFDPNLFSRHQADLGSLFESPLSPLLNRATTGLYPPGSIFKIVSSAAGLLTGKINRDTQFEDTGIIYLGTFSFANWYYTSYGRTEGFLDLVGAIRRSNDIFFYRLGQRVGEEELGRYGRLFGLGEKTGIDLPTEEAGLVPTPAWKEEEIGVPWYPGDTLHMVIGQGDLLTTPLQMSNLVTMVANGGILYRPFLGLKVENGNQSFAFEPEVIREGLIDEASLGLIREGMRQACSKGGTGWPFFAFEPEVGCKTGTAEFGDPKDRTHAWFAAFAPFDHPEIVVTVLVEAGGEGSSVAAPIAKEILKYWFNRERPPEADH